VEKVAAAIRAEVRRMLENPPCEYEALATAAIALIRADVLEEAAGVFDEMWGGITPDDAAAAIRALKETSR
jgi:hypothetical protein